MNQTDHAHVESPTIIRGSHVAQTNGLGRRFAMDSPTKSKEFTTATSARIEACQSSGRRGGSLVE